MGQVLLWRLIMMEMGVKLDEMWPNMCDDDENRMK